MSEAEERIAYIRFLFTELHTQLLWCTHKRRERARERFRKAFYATDLSYIKALISLVYNDLDYQLWKGGSSQGREKSGLRAVLALPKCRGFRRPTL